MESEPRKYLPWLTFLFKILLKYYSNVTQWVGIRAQMFLAVRIAVISRMLKVQALNIKLLFLGTFDASPGVLQPHSQKKQFPDIFHQDGCNGSAEKLD